jgi:hypothetical protein
VIPLVTVSVAVVWTLGVVAQSGALNVTVLLPALLGTVGLSYVMYVFAGGASTPRTSVRAGSQALAGGTQDLPARRGRRRDDGRELRLARTLADPCVREFGIYSVVGVVATMLASHRRPRCSRSRACMGHACRSRGTRGRFERAVVWISAFDVRNRRAIFAVAIGIVVLSALGATRLRVGTDCMGGFKPTHPVQLGFGRSTRSSGANPFSVIVQANADAFKDRTCARSRSCRTGSRAQPESEHHVARRLPEADQPRLPRERPGVPRGARLARGDRAALLLRQSGLERFVDSRFQIANVWCARA